MAWHDVQARPACASGVSICSVIGPLEAAVEEHRVIVTTGAPLARLRADDRLHVLDRLPVELVVERREVVHRALPLLVDVLVTLAAAFGVHEEVGRNRAADIGLRRRGEERRAIAATLLVHRERRASAGLTIRSAGSGLAAIHIAAAAGVTTRSAATIDTPRRIDVRSPVPRVARRQASGTSAAVATAPAATCAMSTHLSSRRFPRRTSSTAKAAATVSAANAIACPGLS